MIKIFSELIKELLDNYVSIKGSALSKGSMVGKLPRILCDKIGNYGISNDNDIRGMVNVGVDSVKSMLIRDQGTYFTFGTDDFLITWMDKFVKEITTRLNGNFGNMRKIREDEIIPLFKTEAIRKNQENKVRHTEQKNAVLKYMDEHNESVIDSIKTFNFSNTDRNYVLKMITTKYNE